MYTQRQNTNCCCGVHPRTCSFGLGVGILVLALLGASFLVVSQLWWAFIAIGLLLITGLALLIAALIEKYVIYLPVLGLCILSILATIAFAIYAFILAANQLHFDHPKSFGEETDVNWTSEQIRGISNLALALLLLIALILLIHAVVSAVTDFKLLKAQTPPSLRSRVANFPSTGGIFNSGRRGHVVETIEVVEEDHCERSTTTPYF